MSRNRVYMVANELTQIPTAIFDNDVHELHLSNNLISEIPSEISRVASTLNLLYLSNNKITEIPHEICSLTQLEELSLSTNYIKSIPSGLSRLTNLRILNLAENEISAIPPEIAKLTKLERLVLRGNKNLHFPPKLICDRGTKAILAWLEDFVFDADKMKNVRIGLNSLPTDLKECFNSKESFSDITLLAQGRRLYAHKLILCARSGFFKEKILKEESEFNEVKSVDMDILDFGEKFPFELFCRVIMYMYTDHIEFTSREEAGEVLEIGESLQMEDRFLTICKRVRMGSSLEHPPSTLSLQLSPFINSTVLSDARLIVEGREVCAHKVILCRCEYFRAMYQQGFKESQQHSTNLPDLKYELLMLILQYLYTDNVTIDTPDTAIELLIASCQYVGLERLKRKCEEFISPLLDDENVCMVYGIADGIHATFLKALCLYYILSNIQTVQKTQGWSELSSQQKDIRLKASRWGFSSLMKQ